MSVQRYDLEICDGDSGRCHARLVADDLGEWCRAEDVAALEARNAELEAEVARLREEATGVVEAWDWWLVDTSDRCRSVPQDAVESLRAALEDKS